MGSFRGGITYLTNSEISNNFKPLFHANTDSFCAYHKLSMEPSSVYLFQSLTISAYFSLAVVYALNVSHSQVKDLLILYHFPVM